jgi:hypothetical protein
MSKRGSPRLSKKRSAKSALDFYIEDEDVTEKDADTLGVLDDGSIVHDRDEDTSCSPNNDDKEAAYDELDDKDVIMDDEYHGGIVVSDGLVEYDYFNIHNTVKHFRMGGRHAVFAFYPQLVKPLKQGRKKLGIVCVLCFNTLEGTEYYQWRWVKSNGMFTNNTINLFRHLEKNHVDIASVNELLSKK